ncbi:hypothetical protein QQS21_005121 [Conoideocrella luteorostrata]|uniref:NACHT domain-containing protein n=1 Tax=Conoideocrella luteorostrata TaxID=1105319 RepID=A0AAJ0CQA2_9HYPO|nr:hypothetical protein QQS21_005121 [Conoideocrella luteorostrata]
MDRTRYSPQDRAADDQRQGKDKSKTRGRLTILYPEQNSDAADDADVDIVAVHGLGSDADWSWIFKDGHKPIHWLRDPDMLPAKVPKSRIALYSYESRWHADAPKTRLSLCGEELAHSLRSFRAGCPRRPIILVGHSLGGNVIVQALLYAEGDDKCDELLKATAGFVFLGSPLRGTKWQPFLNSVARLMTPASSHDGITKELGYDEPLLRDRLHQFCKLRNKLLIPGACFSELYKSDYSRRIGIARLAKGMVVEEASACIPGLDRYALEKDHFQINKYYGPTDPAFERVSTVISELYYAANGVVQCRFNPREVIVDNRVALEHSPEAEACLCDLFVTDPLEDKKAMKRKKGNRAGGTCEWILGTEDLTAWLATSPARDSKSQATGGVMWLHGNPGTGKSTLAMFLTDALSTNFSTTDGNTLAYFFCDSAFNTRRTATSVVRGLLLQLIQQHPQLLNHVMPKYKQRGAKLFDSFDALWIMFISAAADAATGQKYCIIDALDECEPESQTILLHQIRETFQSPDAPINVRILVTSRPYSEIAEFLEGFVNKNLASFFEIEQDINLFIDERATELAKRKKYSNKVKNQVIEILRSKAQGTFLWVGVACKELENIPSKDAIACLNAMPRGLYSLYYSLLDMAFEREVDKDAIRLILSFVAVSQRPLHILELSEACALHLDEDDTETRTQFIHEHIASCRLIVVVQDEKVLLLHQSVKDFLLKDSQRTCFNELDTHADFAYRCLDYLIMHFHETEKGDHFLGYATKEWPHHARMAQANFTILPRHADFFTIGSSCREMWLSLHRRASSYDKVPHLFSILHVAAKWGIPAIAKHAFSASVDNSSIRASIHAPDVSGLTPLELAVNSKYENVVPVLLDLEAEVTKHVLRGAAENDRNSTALMSLLLDRRGGEITITEGVVKTAARNWRSGKEIMALLLDHRGGEIAITEEVVKAAAGNGQKEVMALLLDRRGGEITITEEVVKAAAGNWRSSKEVMALLLDRRGGEITITEEVVKAAAGNENNGKEVIALLLERQGGEITITEEVVKAAAGKGQKEVMALLLDHRGGEITITEELVKAVAGNENNSKEVMALLLDRQGGEITITEEVLKAAAGNEESGKEVMALLLERQGGEITITEEVVKAAAGNWRSGKEVIALLLDRQGGEIAITEEVIKAAAGNWQSGTEVMILLLDCQGGEITITEEVLKAATRNPTNGKEVMALLLERRGSEITITEEVVKAAAGRPYNGKEMMALLLDYQGGEITITEEVVKAAAGNEESGKEVMALLLERQGGEITITEEVVKAAAGNGNNGKEVIELLLERRGSEITITEEVIKAAAGNWPGGKEVMALLLERQGGEITITEEVVKAAARNLYNSKKVIALLLERRGSEITITEDVLKAAARNLNHGKEVIALLLERRGSELTITEEVVKAAARRPYNGKDMMALLLECRGSEITITEEVVKAAAGNEESGKEVMTLLFNQPSKESSAFVTENVLTTAATCGNIGVLDFLSQQTGLIFVEDEYRQIAEFYQAAKAGHVLRVEQLLRKGTKPDLKNLYGQTPLWIAAMQGHTAVVTILSQRPDVDVNSLSNSRQSPLFWPSRFGRKGIVAILLNAGANPNYVDKEGNTALTYARENGHKEVIELLMNHKQEKSGTRFASL